MAESGVPLVISALVGRSGWLVNLSSCPPLDMPSASHRIHMLKTPSPMQSWASVTLP